MSLILDRLYSNHWYIYLGYAKKCQKDLEITNSMGMTCRLLDDHADRYDRAYSTRKKLEDDWVRAVQHKRSKDQEERDHICDPGQLLTEQFDRHKRCLQCKRRLNNCGESNIWRESRYIPGSRIMV